MRLIEKWRIALIIAVVVIAIPIAARVDPTQTELVEPSHLNLYRPTATNTEVAKTAHTTKAGLQHRVVAPQDYYDRRREYWEKRMERRADYLEQEDGDDEDAADSNDSKNSKDSASDEDEGDSMNDEEELIERRREYWRDRLDRDWD
jgi:hypothetical protein